MTNSVAGFGATARFIVIDDSGHPCCMSASVVDTAKPTKDINGRVTGKFATVCECFDDEDAAMIAAALNATQNTGETS